MSFAVNSAELVAVGVFNISIINQSRNSAHCDCK